jgi:hypothetical protein
MLTVHPMDRPPAPLPLNDVYNSTTLIPYLENLYDEFYQDDDTVGTYGMMNVCARGGGGGLVQYTQRKDRNLSVLHPGQADG